MPVDTVDTVDTKARHMAIPANMAGIKVRGEMACVSLLF
jgi:hypothetical protein